MSFNGIHLTPNAIKTFYGPPRPVQTTTLQVINIKLIETTGPASPDRYRLIVSDGTFFMQAMLATQLNDYVSSGSLGKHSIIRVSKYVCNAVGIKRILIVLTMDVLTPNNANVPKIGSPVSIDQEESKMQAAAAPQLHQQQVQAPVKQQSYPQADAPASVFTIKSLNPYQNRWTIKARVLAKGGIKRFRNAKGDGQLFSVTFSDESGEIRATGFGDAVTMFHDMLQVGQVYYISKCALKVANKQWSTVNNDYEMTFDSSSSISLCTDGSMPVIKYNNVELGRLSDVPVGSSIDVVGILKECLPIQSITTKKQSQVNKRDIAIVDMSGWLVRCTLWGEQADSFDHTGTPVVAFKGLKVSDFNGRSLGCSDTTAIAINPDIPEAHRLRGWYDATGHGLAFESYSRDGATGSSSTPMLTISDITDNGLGLGEKPDYLAMYGTVSYVRSENPWYPACPNAGCNKKVMDLGGEWRCEKCDMQFPAPNYRYILSFTVCDPTGQIWLQAFNDDAESMIGRTADEMSQLKVNNLMQEADELGYKQVFQQLLYQEFHFKCRAKQEMYQDEAKMRISTVKITKMDYAARCKELLANIASLA